MKKKTNISVQDVRGIRRTPDLILGDKVVKNVSGDIMDANATEELVNDKIAEVIGTAPEILDTLGEIVQELETKADKSDLDEKADKSELDSKVDISELEQYVTHEELHQILISIEDNYYGIRWTDANTTPTRIGNDSMHHNLPLQKQMKRCMLQDDGTVYGYISDVDPTKYTDGRNVDYTGAHGQCMVEIPEYYYDAYTYVDGNDTVHLLLLYPYATSGKKSKKFYVSAFEAASNDADTDASTKKLFSICTTDFTVSNNLVQADDLTYTAQATKYRGGSARTTSTDDDTIKSKLGRPVTNLTRAQFRQRGAARGTGWSQQYWDAYMSIVRLYVVEYCNFNTQAAYNPSLSAEGFKQGGLGDGVSTVSYGDWTSFNGTNPLIPCGITKSLVNETGIIDFKYEATEFGTNAVTLHVPSYRGIENPFAHIWKWTDGLNVNTVDNITSVYTCNDITKFADDTANNYQLRAEFNAPESGYIKTWNWDENGDFIPTSTGGSASSYLYDHSYWSTGWRVLLSGGGAGDGAHCGWFYFNALYGSGIAATGIGGRLYYTPAE